MHMVLSLCFMLYAALVRWTLLGTGMGDRGDCEPSGWLQHAPKHGYPYVRPPAMAVALIPATYARFQCLLFALWGGVWSSPLQCCSLKYLFLQ